MPPTDLVEEFRLFLAAHIDGLRLPPGRNYGQAPLGPGLAVEFVVRKDHVGVGFCSDGKLPPEIVTEWIDRSGLRGHEFFRGQLLEPCPGKRNPEVVRVEFTIPLASTQELSNAQVREDALSLFSRLQGVFGNIAADLTSPPASSGRGNRTRAVRLEAHGQRVPEAGVATSIGGAPAQDRAQTIRDHLVATGIRAEVDSDGDITMEVEGRAYVVQLDRDDPLFYRLSLPAFWSIDSDEEEARVVAAALAVTAEALAGKVFTVNGSTWASVDVFCTSCQVFCGGFSRYLGELDLTAGAFVAAMRSSVASGPDVLRCTASLDTGRHAPYRVRWKSAAMPIERYTPRIDEINFYDEGDADDVMVRLTDSSLSFRIAQVDGDIFDVTFDGTIAFDLTQAQHEALEGRGLSVDYVVEFAAPDGRMADSDTDYELVENWNLALEDFTAA